MQFFQTFPYVDYTLTEGNAFSKITRTVPNMTVKLVMDILDSPSIPFNTYRIIDGDRPDTVSARLYGASRYAWIILLANNMRDWYDWPLTDKQFNEYMNRKYESSEGANDGYVVSLNSVAKYVWIISDGKEIEVDFPFYNSLPSDGKKQISIFEIEYQSNDNKREIRTPSLSTISMINSELNRLLTI